MMKNCGTVSCYLALLQCPVIGQSIMRNQHNSHDQTTKIVTRTNTGPYIKVKILPACACVLLWKDSMWMLNKVANAPQEF